jgi:hypothetical protein
MFKLFIKKFLSTSTKYIILEESTSNLPIIEFLNNTPAVIRISVDEEHPYILGGQNIPHDQIRDFRASRLENFQQNAVAYTTNISDIAPIVSADNLNTLLIQSAPNITISQQELLLSSGISTEGLEDLRSINGIIRLGVEQLTLLNTEDISYASRIYNFIREANNIEYSNLSFTTNPYHLYYLNLNNNDQLESTNREIMRFFINVRGGPLASRILNIFFALGLNFMDYIYSRFSVLSSNTLPIDWFNNSSELFLVYLRQSLSSLFILFLGIDQFISIDLGQMLYSLRLVVLYLGPIIGIIRSYNLIISTNFFHPVVENARQTIISHSSGVGTNVSWMSYFQSFFNSINFTNYFSVGSTVSSVGFITYHLLRYLHMSGFSRSFLPLIFDQLIGYILNFTSIRANSTSESNSQIVNANEEGSITRFFNQFNSGFQEFLRRFRYL